MVELIHICNKSNQQNQSATRESTDQRIHRPRKSLKKPRISRRAEEPRCVRTGGQRLDHAGPPRAEVPEHVFRRTMRPAAVHFTVLGVLPELRRVLGLGFWNRNWEETEGSLGRTRATSGRKNGFLESGGGSWRGYQHEDSESVEGANANFCRTRPGIDEITPEFIVE